MEPLISLLYLTSSATLFLPFFFPYIMVPEQGENKYKNNNITPRKVLSSLKTQNDNFHTPKLWTTQTKLVGWTFRKIRRVNLEPYNQPFFIFQFESVYVDSLWNSKTTNFFSFSLFWHVFEFPVCGMFVFPGAYI